MRSVVLLIVFVVSGCGGSDEANRELSGTWTATITENGENSVIRLEIISDGTQHSGRITVLDHTGTDTKEGTEIDLSELEVWPDRIQFVLPVFGQIDEEAVRFVLRDEDGDLKGYGQEMRDGSEPLPVTFERFYHQATN